MYMYKIQTFLLVPTVANKLPKPGLHPYYCAYIKNDFNNSMFHEPDHILELAQIVDVKLGELELLY